MELVNARLLVMSVRLLFCWFRIIVDCCDVEVFGADWYLDFVIGGSGGVVFLFGARARLLGLGWFCCEYAMGVVSSGDLWRV